FYQELFRRFSGYEDLDYGWRRDKAEIAAWLAQRLERGSRILSVGAGLGYVEYCLQMHEGRHLELHVEDVAPEALQWLRKELPPGGVQFVNAASARHPADTAYDLIYLSA